MCGRFALTSTELEIKNYFKLSGTFVMRPRYNIAPFQSVPVIRSNVSLDFLKWGLIPSWTQDSAANPQGYINARAETLLEKPTFKRAAFTRRCIIPATGYYEWRLLKDKKQPYYITLKPLSDSEEKSTLFGIAAIWESWQCEGVRQETCAIITVPAVSELSSLSDRMPLILSQAHHQHWLTSKIDAVNWPKTLNYFLVDKQYITYPVSSQINNPRFDAIQCLQSL